MSRMPIKNRKKMEENKIKATFSIHSDPTEDFSVSSTSLTQLPSSKFILNSPPLSTQPIMLRTTSTPMVGKEMEILNFIDDSETFEDKNNSNDMPLLPIPSVFKKRMLASEKLKLGLLNSKPKFCPFCNYVCEKKIDEHIKSKHTDRLKFPITVSAEAIKKIILNSSRKNKILVPFNRIVSIMGNYWSDPEMRKISYELCLLGQLIMYGGSWNLENVPDIPNPFAQYIIQAA